MSITIHFFDEISHHAAALDSWSQCYDQLTPGGFRGSLHDLQLPGMRLFRERLSSRVAQHTRAPHGTANILMPVRVDSTRTGILSDGLTVLPRDGDFYFCTPPHTDYVVISLQLDGLEQLLVPEDFDSFHDHPRGYGLHCPPATLQRLQQRVLEGMDLAGRGTGADPTLPLWLRDEVVCMLLTQMDGSAAAPRPHDLGASHLEMVRHCHARVLETDAPPGMLAFCRELKIPHRTLHHAFECTTGLSPNRYLRAVRLNAAHRGLCASPDTSITDAAYRWGFSHSSHFGKEYKKLFGRTPSRRSS